MLIGKYLPLMPSMALINHLLNVLDGEVNGSVSSVSAKLAAASCDYLESHVRKIFIRLE